MNNKSLSFKLSQLSLSLIGLAVGVGVVGLMGSSIMAHEYRKIAEFNLPNISSINKMFINIRRARSNANQLAIEGATEAETKETYDGIKLSMDGYAESVKAYLAVDFLNSDEEALWNDLKKTNDEYFLKIQRVAELGRTKYDPNSAAATEMRELLLHDLLRLTNESKDKYEKLERFHVQSAEDNVKAAAWTERISFGLTLLFIITGGLVGWRYSRRFSAGLVSSLTAVSDALSEAGSQVSSAATEISASSQTLSSASVQQAASLAETAASIEEMNSMVAKNNENAHSAASVSQQSEQTANRGQSGIAQMIASMDEIAKSNEQVADIVKVIREIGEKTKVINDIVFQTKLLSFNASVEAARAGEHGKGFAVVAEEVGNLAQMSGNASKEISSLLESSLAKVEAIVSETKRKVAAGTATAHESGEILNDIVKNVSRVSVMAGDISTASAEQATGVGEITKAMNQLDQVTQQNASTSQEAASAAEELSAQAESLNTLVGQLVTLVHGGNTAPVQAVSTNHVAAAHPTPSNVISIQRAKKAKAPIAAKVVTKSSTPLAKAAGEVSPRFDDKRFEDI